MSDEYGINKAIAKKLFNTFDLKKDIEQLERRLKEVENRQKYRRLKTELVKKKRELESKDTERLRTFSGFVIIKQIARDILDEKDLDPFELLYKQYKKEGLVIKTID